MRAAKAQASLPIGANSTEPSLPHDAISTWPKHPVECRKRVNILSRVFTWLSDVRRFESGGGGGGECFF